MIKLKVNKPAEKFEGTITAIESNEGKYGQEIIITWDTPEYPLVSKFYESYNLGSEMYGEANFERLAKFYNIFTGEQLNKEGVLNPEKLIGKKALLSFAEKNGKRYIASKKLIEVELVKKDDDFLNDDLPF